MAAMSDTEAPAVAPVEEEEAPAAEEAPVLTLPKERVKKPVRPDDTELKAQTELLQGQINKNKLRMQQILQIIDDKKAGRSEGSKEQQAVKSKLAELKGQFQSYLGQKTALRGQLDTARKTREVVRASLKDLKSNMKFTTVEAIDEQIVRLEERVNHSTLTLNEEKRCLEDIKKLKQSRSAVGQYSDKLSQLAQDESATDDLMAKLKGLDEELNKIKAKEEVLRAELAEIREKEQEKSSDIPSLFQERDECREICKQAYEKIKELRAEHNEKWEEYKLQNQLFNMQRNEDRKRKQEAWDAERARRDEERAARMAELTGEPFDKEVTMCEQVLNYLSKYVVTEAAVAEAKKADLAAPEKGFALFQKKEDEEDAWVMGVGKKGAKGGKGKAKKGGEEKKAAAGDEKLVHSLDILDAFTTLKLEVPLTKSKVAPLLEEVKAKKEYFLQKREEVKENGVAPMEPQEEGADEGKGEAEAGSEEGAAVAAAAPKGGKGSKANGRLPSLAALKLDDESWPSVSAAASGAPATAASDKGGEEEEEEDAATEEEAAAVEVPAADEEEAPAAAVEEAAEEEQAEAAAAPAGEVSVSLTVSDDDGQAVTLAIVAH